MEYVRYRIDPHLAELLSRLNGSSLGQSLVDRLTQLVEIPEPTPVGATLASALRAHQWLLNRAAVGGIPLTAAGYLKPTDVKELAEVLPTMDGWIFTVSREVDAHPVLGFRTFVQKAGLLRKYKGHLVLSKAGKAAQQSTSALWGQLAEHLIPTKPYFDQTATVLIVLHIATSPAEQLNATKIARALEQLGWADAGGRPVTASDVHWVANEVWDAIGNVGTHVSTRHGDRTPSSAAISLIRDSLLKETPPPALGPQPPGGSIRP